MPSHAMNRKRHEQDEKIASKQAKAKTGAASAWLPYAALTFNTAVGIMDGSDEGIFSWFTLNFHTGRLTSANTLAALDLGGGSNQVTYTMNDKDSEAHRDFIHSVRILKADRNVFTNSYLGLGLMVARYAIFTEGTNRTTVDSVCVAPGVRGNKWRYGATELSVGGETSVEDFKRRALQVCGGEYEVPGAPFLCLDLTFISTLLEQGFGLDPKTRLRLFKQVDGHEINWALGCAYSLLTGV